jgi:nitrite reductase/ring-hydroxylating ferredoxin subunit/uncharacterized membrane protein
MIDRQVERALANPSLAELIPTIEQALKQTPGLERMATRLAQALHNAVLDGGGPARTIADVLHGTWFGHPLHPALTDIPVGAWALAALFDLYAALGGGRFAERTADTLIALGAAGAVPTALSGLADYSTIKEDAAAVGAAHAVLNSTALGLYLLSLWARKRGARGSGVLLAAVALGAVGLSAGLGGDLVYRHRIGVSHAPPADEPEEWTAVLPLDELAHGVPQRVDLHGTPVLIYHDAGAVSAISAVCTHAGGPLDEGTFADGCVECPWHQSVFDVRDGRVVHGPATMSQPRYDARIHNGQVEVRARSAGG